VIHNPSFPIGESAGPFQGGGIPDEGKEVKTMPFDKEGKYYLEDVPHGQKASAYMIESVYQEAKKLCEHDTRSQEAFNGLVVFLGDCGYTMQKAILHLLKEGEFGIFKR
jgi:hypothetical protein